jgi:hypothetical protein
MKRRALAR